MKVPDGLPPAYTESSSDPPDYPPPPGIAHPYSTGANATLADADRALAWCARHPLAPPVRPSDEQLRLIHATQQPLTANPDLTGTIRPVDQATNAWLVTTRPGCKDALIQAALPSYAALAHRPRDGGVRRAYFEMRVVRLGPARAEKPPPGEGHASHHLGGLLHLHRHETARARRDRRGRRAARRSGSFAPPYPPSGCPGGIGGARARVHGDDGRRFVANENGGVDFTSPFRAGETVGLGTPSSARPPPPPAGEGGSARGCSARGTGRSRAGGIWRGTRTRRRERTEGLEGERDLVAGVGVSLGRVEVGGGAGGRGDGGLGTGVRWGRMAWDRHVPRCPLPL